MTINGRVIPENALDTHCLVAEWLVDCLTRGAVITPDDGFTPEFIRPDELAEANRVLGIAMEQAGEAFYGMLNMWEELSSRGLIR